MLSILVKSFPTVLPSFQFQKSTISGSCFQCDQSIYSIEVACSFRHSPTTAESLYQMFDFTFSCLQQQVLSFGLFKKPRTNLIFTLRKFFGLRKVPSMFVCNFLNSLFKTFLLINSANVIHCLLLLFLDVKYEGIIRRC